jgi:hypothetical protein
VRFVLSERNAEVVELTGDLSKMRIFLAFEEEKAAKQSEEWIQKVPKPENIKPSSVK